MQIFKWLGIKKYTINDLPEYEKVNANKLRSSFSILIIDDEDDIEDDCNSLKDLEFKVTRVKDIEAIDFIKGFDIVVCDIQGVGRKLNKKYEGAYLMKEIRIKFPGKILIGYTGKVSDPSFNNFLKKCDLLITKDALFDDIADVFDTYLQDMNNPRWIWLRHRRVLVEHEVSTASIVDIEDNYVRSIINKNNYITDSYIDRFAEPAKNILCNLVSSFIFKSLTGV